MSLAISIVIPAKNEAKYIESTLKHLIVQELPRESYEIIVNDAYSTDKTAELSRKYADKIIKSYTKNPAEGRNIGAKKALGRVVVFLDADTLIEKNTLKIIKENIEKGYVGGTFLVSGIGANLLDNFFIFLMNSTEIILSTLGFKIGNGQCLFLRKDVFNKIRGFNTDLDVNEDQDIMRRAGRLGRIALLHNKVKISLRRVRKQGWLKLYWIWISTFFVSFFSKKVDVDYWSDKK